jgi:integrase
MAPKSSRPGIYRLQDGGFLVRGRIDDPVTGKRRTVIKRLPDAKVEEAQRTLDQMKSDVRDRVHGRAPVRQLFSDFAVSLFQAKVTAGDIRSAKGFARWRGTLECHLIPAFGDVPCASLSPWHLANWRTTIADRIANGWTWRMKLRNGKLREHTGHLSPRTANGWFSILRVISAAMTSQLDLPKDPCLGLKDFDTTQRPTYTDEAPNALTSAWTAKFLVAMKERFPQHYAMTLLGFVTGKRPSTLRRSGPEADIDWGEHFVRFRRSHTLGPSTMVGTKTGTRERVYLPEVVIAELRAHSELLSAPPISARGKPPMWWSKKMAESELLFPARTGGLRTSSVLDAPFRIVTKLVGLPYKLTPRAMRRTFNDLAREAQVHDVVTRSITGHKTEAMHGLYSTADPVEQRDAIAKVIHLVTAREARQAARGSGS